ncbi:hypothetical protein LTR08_004064 [Meristemomyces frigidus]|nr:hypothetical protein LTR08_004064 [Meristemomyces frigidus]
MALSYGTSDYIECGGITAVIPLNSKVGSFQDYNAEQIIAPLRAMTALAQESFPEGSAIDRFGPSSSPCAQKHAQISRHDTASQASRGTRVIKRTLAKSVFLVVNK